MSKTRRILTHVVHGLALGLYIYLAEYVVAAWVVIAWMWMHRSEIERARAEAFKKVFEAKFGAL